MRRIFVWAFAICAIALVVALLPDAAMSQGQLEDLGGPKWQTPLLKNLDGHNVLTKIVMPILQNQGYKITSVEEAQGCEAVSPEKRVEVGWRAGSFERLTYRIRLGELRQKDGASYKIYIAVVRVERKGGWDAKWVPVSSPEGIDPFPSLIEAIKQGISLVTQGQ